MTTLQIFSLADESIEAGCFPGLVGKRYILVLQFEGGPAVRVHRKFQTIQLSHPCRVWLMSGRIRVLLGDCAALPLCLPEGVRPPFTM